MAEARQTIIERIARFAMELVGAEEVEEGIEKVDRHFHELAQEASRTNDSLRELQKTLRGIGYELSTKTLKVLPETVKFFEKYFPAADRAAHANKEFSTSIFAATEGGEKLARAIGEAGVKFDETAGKAGGLKDAFWSLNTVARGLLRIFVGFKVLMGVLGIFKEMAEASFTLQAELARLRAVVVGVSDQIEGGAGTWEEWLDRLERLRKILPLISMTELVTGLRSLTGVLGPLGLTANEIENVAGLVGEMSTLMGRDFPSYISLFIGALSGAQRNVAAMGIDLRDGNRALQDYAETLGFVWDELNAGQKQWIRLGFFVEQAAERTVELTEVLNEEWAQLEALRKKREDILTQSPELIAAQIKWAEILIIIAERAKALVGVLEDAVNTSYQLIYILLYLTKGTEEFARIWEAHQEAFRMEPILEWIADLREPWQEMGEVAEDFNKTVRENAEALEDAGDSADEFASRMERALQQARNALRSYQNAVESAAIRLGRRLADIVRNLEEKLSDLESRFELRRSQLIARFEERRAELREKGAEKEEELREDLNKRLRRMEEDHQLEMQELREDYLIDLEEAARKRDAVSMRRIQQRYILEKKQRERDYGVRRRRAIVDYKAQLDELKKAREEQERELEKSLERQLRELQENYERQQEEARLNAERQREDALRNYQEQLSDLWRSFQDRLESIIISLMEEEDEWESTYSDLRSFLDEWYRDDLIALVNWLNARKDALEDAGVIEPSPPIPPQPIPPGPTPYAQGGMGIARGPTPIVVGEEGPEMFAVWPLGGRMPRAGIDVRLTIDGTQSGDWSADFENQTLRILREVLEEAL